MEIIPVLSTVLVVAVLATGLYAWSLVWVYRDAQRRGQNGLLIALLVALVAWPFGLLAWIAFRPVRRV